MNTKKLKQLVLDLAIHGKLVPQDPNDEPASELLKRISSSKKTVKRSKISFNENVSKEEAPFDVPQEWCWCRLGSLLNIFGRIGFRGYTKADLVEKGEGAITLSPSNIIDNKMDYSSCTYISWEKYEESPEIKIFNGDILVVKTGSSYGKCSLVDNLSEKATINPQFVVLKDIMCDNKYVTCLLQSEYARNEYNEFVLGTAIPTFTQVKLAEMLIPLPPLAEQHRIVAAIEKWFAVIDQLEKNEADLKKSIEQTKKKVLDLAIRGKLVAQNPEDEPAGELLARIRADVETRGRASNKAKGKKSAIPSVDLDEVPFEVPSSWCWTRLDGVCDIKGGKRVPKGMSFSDVPTNHIYIRVTNMKQHTIVDSELKYIDDDVYAMIKNYTISSKDLYLTVAGTIGDVGSVPEMYDGMNLTENAVKLTSIICEKDFLKYVLLTDYVQEHFSSKFHQVAQPKLSIETASSAIFPLPPLAEQKRIVEKIEEVMGVLERIEGV